MIFLLFILSAFPGITDNCTAIDCTMKSDYRGLPTEELVGTSATVKAHAATLASEYNVVIEDATAGEIAKEATENSVNVDMKGKLQAGTNLTNVEMREILLYLIER